MRRATTPRVTVADSAAALRALRAPWTDLCDRCPWTTPFQRPEWLLPWLDVLGPTCPWPSCLWTVCAWHEGRLVGLAPLFVWGHWPRVVSLLGAGVSDYLDVLCEPAHEPDLTSALVDHLHARRRDWDECRFEDLRATSPLCRVRWPDTWPADAEPDGSWWVARLADAGRDVGAGEPLAWLPEPRRKRMLTARRLAARRGALHLSRADAATWPALWPELLRLHGARWRSRGEDGVLADDRIARFHRRVVAGFAATGRLLLFVLRIGDRPAAALYGFCERATWSYYLGGFDPALARLSPGSVLVGLVADEARRRGALALDFLRGDEDYKRLWGASPRPRLRLRVRAR